mgnify:CR=1 FL=1
MRISELIDRTGVPERQIRYLIAEGFMPPPSGGRANADYGDAHVMAIQRYARLRELGFPPAAIKLLLKAEQGTPFPIVPGLTLLISPDMIASGAPAEPLVRRIETLLTRILEEPRDADRSADSG